jgi:hypothetical protein
MQKNEGSRPVWPLVLMAAGILLIVGAVGGYFYYSSNLAALPTPTPATSLSGPESIARVEPGDAYTAYTGNEAIFLDVRSAEQYSQSHVKGAISIPLEELPDRLNELNPDDWIIPY